MVKEYDVPGNVSIRRDGMHLTILAVRAGIVEDYETRERISNTVVRLVYGDFPSEIEAALQLMEEAGWVKKLARLVIPLSDQLSKGSVTVDGFCAAGIAKRLMLSKGMFELLLLLS